MRNNSIYRISFYPPYNPLKLITAAAVIKANCQVEIFFFIPINFN